jgi:hypothetical protein
MAGIAMILIEGVDGGHRHAEAWCWTVRSSGSGVGSAPLPLLPAFPKAA